MLDIPFGRSRDAKVAEGRDSAKAHREADETHDPCKLSLVAGSLPCQSVFGAGTIQLN